MPSLSFGIFQRLMFGASMELDNYIGHGDVDLQRPELQIKFRFYDGGSLPAAAIGYDSQGHNFDKTRNDYRDTERGLYLAFSQEMLTQGLEWTAGVNISDFKEDALRAYLNASWVAPLGGVGLFAEYDDINHAQWNRLNAGINLFLSPFVQMGFHVRDLLGYGTYKNSLEKRHPERIIDIRYLTSF